MTSSIYPFIPSLATTTITTPGSDYTTTPTVTFDSPPIGATATGTANIADGVIDVITGFSGGSLYTNGEEVILSGGTGTGATAIAVISGETVQSITFTNRGSEFTASDPIIITGVISGANNAMFTVDSIADNAVSSITITNGGTGYTSAPNIAITGGDGSGATAVGVFTIRATPIPSTSNILLSDISITTDNLRPGGGGVLRLYFAFTFTGPLDGIIQIFNNSALKGDLNADNSGSIVDNGYYRFDIDVEAGDNINLQLKSGAGGDSIIGINFIRAHLVLFGA